MGGFGKHIHRVWVIVMGLSNEGKVLVSSLVQIVTDVWYRYTGIVSSWLVCV